MTERIGYVRQNLAPQGHSLHLFFLLGLDVELVVLSGEGAQRKKKGLNRRRSSFFVEVSFLSESGTRIEESLLTEITKSETVHLQV
jgi:hypothetical protein